LQDFDLVFSRDFLLKKFPDSGRFLPKFPDLPFHEVIVKSYRFFYKVRDKTVRVIAGGHSAQSSDGPEERQWVIG
jgi:hypothetical protein